MNVIALHNKYENQVELNGKNAISNQSDLISNLISF